MTKFLTLLAIALVASSASANEIKAPAPKAEAAKEMKIAENCAKENKKDSAEYQACVKNTKAEAPKSAEAPKAN